MGGPSCKIMLRARGGRVGTSCFTHEADTFDETYREQDEDLTDAIGYRSPAQIILSAICDDMSSHRGLAHLAAEEAERRGGCFVCLGIAPQLPPEGELPGRIVAVPEGRNFVHYVDAVFLRAWLAHPNFHLTT
jgi:hypothetical protein